MSWNGPLLISSATRLQGVFFWDLLVYLIEGLVFLLTGLQARTLIDNGHLFSLAEVLVAIGWVTLIVIAARFVWVFPTSYFPRWLIPRRRRRQASTPWQSPFLLAYTGIRGVVSLAAALALPYALDNGEPFPHRELILFVTFGVIVVTLIGQGLSLPSVVRGLGLARSGHEEHRSEIKAELVARQQALEEVSKRLDKAIADHELPEEAVRHLRTRNQSREQILPRNLEDSVERMRETVAVKRDLIDAERKFIFKLLRDGKITDEVRRRIEYELDLEEASLANRDADGGGWI
jgi:CPA1 family monovalent cation:H+ antiporter